MLIHLLRSAATADPDAEAVVTASGVVTYGEWLDRAESIARGLRDAGIAKFACVIEDVPTLLAMLCAASSAGAEPCSYLSSATREMVATLAASCAHTTILTDRNDLVVEGDVRLIDPHSLERPGAREEGEPETSPVLILTTGTTGTPKAARHDWRRLVKGVRVDAVPPGSRWLLAYNLNQFAGIQVFLHALAGRATLVVPPSNQPRTALAFARDAGVTHISATPTFWRFGLGLIDDPSALPLQQITLGGEAVPGPLLDRLCATFPGVRISQVYASTEDGSAVSVTDMKSGLPISVLTRNSDASAQMRVVDGELQIRSRVGMLGYSSGAGPSAAGPDAAVPGDVSADPSPWRSTGDLVEIRGDRIHFVGRVHEIINVGGVKVHPLPIEDAALSVEGVMAAHAYGRSNPVTGQIVALDVVLMPGAVRDEVEAAIRDSVAALQPASRPRRIRFVDTLEVRENKIVRPAP